MTDENDQTGGLMRRLVFYFALLTLVCYNAVPSSSQKRSKAEPLAQKPRDYPVKPVPFTSVPFYDSFWAPRLEINRKVSIPFAFKKDEETKRIYHFERA